MKYSLLLVRSAGALFCLAPALHAQQSVVTTTPTTAAVATPTPADVFQYEVNRVTSKTGDAQTVYSIRMTQLLTSKLTGQKLRLLIDKSQPGGTSARQLTINTGKYKTTGQMSAYLADVFRRFLAGPVAANQEFGKIGDVKFGGEIHFIADSADSLRYDIVTPTGPGAGGGSFSRADVQAFLTILSGPKA